MGIIIPPEPPEPPVPPTICPDCIELLPLYIIVHYTTYSGFLMSAVASQDPSIKYHYEGYLDGEYYFVFDFCDSIYGDYYIVFFLVPYMLTCAVLEPNCNLFATCEGYELEKWELFGEYVPE